MPHSVEALSDAVCLLHVTTGGGGRALPGPETVNLHEVAATAGVRTGTIWTLKESDDMNASLVRFDTGQGVRDHINDEVDALIIGISGSGIAKVDDEEHTLGAGILVFVPKRGPTLDLGYHCRIRLPLHPQATRTARDQSAASRKV